MSFTAPLTDLPFYQLVPQFLVKLSRGQLLDVIQCSNGCSCGLPADHQQRRGGMQHWQVILAQGLQVLDD